MDFFYLGILPPLPIASYPNLIPYGATRTLIRLPRLLSYTLGSIQSCYNDTIMAPHDNHPTS